MWKRENWSNEKRGNGESCIYFLYRFLKNKKHYKCIDFFSKFYEMLSHRKKYVFFLLNILWPNSKMISMVFLCWGAFDYFLRLISILRKTTWSGLSTPTWINSFWSPNIFSDSKKKRCMIDCSKKKNSIPYEIGHILKIYW